ncbi:MAG: leucine-rich repeat domain-containing protein [Bacteroidaceae bacterium]|nr:leucine-rich repeat domain-containing protein [Bacteroidaceae bacterium]
MKTKYFILALVICCGIINVSAQTTFVISNLHYTVTGNSTVKVRANEDISGNLTIPESVTFNGNHYVVTAIEDNGFKENYITSVSIPKTIISIGNHAFQKCSILELVSFPTSDANLSDIGANAFSKCTGLQSIIIPENVNTIGYSAFEGCSAMSSISFSGAPNLIGEYAFLNCNALKKVIIQNLDIWFNMSFEYAGNPLGNDGHLYLADNPSSEITHISIPSSITEIGDYQFSGWGALKSVEFHDGLKKINSSAFAYTGLKKIQLPSSISKIGGHAFDGCKSLTEIIFPENLMVIDGYTFRGCINLRDLTLPKSIVSIGENAFNGIGVTNLFLPEGVKTIGYGAFSSCNYLKTIHIPSSIVSIEKSAFYQNYGSVVNRIQEVTCYKVTPPAVFSSTFSLNYSGMKPTLHVPVGSGDAYRNADVWKEFNIVEDLTTGIDDINKDNLTTDQQYFTIDGKHLTGKPTNSGIYIKNGKKYIVK